MPTLLTMKNQNLCKYNKKMANAQDLFDLLPTHPSNICKDFRVCKCLCNSWSIKV